MISHYFDMIYAIILHARFTYTGKMLFIIIYSGNQRTTKYNFTIVLLKQLKVFKNLIVIYAGKLFVFIPVCGFVVQKKDIRIVNYSQENTFFCISGGIKASMKIVLFA